MTPTALAIVTYADNDRPPEVADRLPRTIASLERTGYRGPVFIVDDGSVNVRQLDYLAFLERETGYTVVRRPANGGISRAKNTALRVIMETGAATGFLAEDDILFQEGWDAAYLEAMSRTTIPHFSWWIDHPENREVDFRGFRVVRTAALLGQFLTFTRDVVERVGGFKVLPRRYGFEHVHWTQRIVHAGLCPFWADVVNSGRFIQLGAHPSTLSEEEKRECIRENSACVNDVSVINQPLHE
jgi:GT2 family glycosyltransferase